MKDRPEQKTEKRRRNRALLWQFLKGSKALYLVSILSAGITALADMAEPQVIRMAVDNALGGKEPAYSKPVMVVADALGGFAYLGRHIWIMAIVILCIAMIRVFSQYTFRVSNSRGCGNSAKFCFGTAYVGISHCSSGCPFSEFYAFHES